MMAAGKGDGRGRRKPTRRADRGSKDHGGLVSPEIGCERAKRPDTRISHAGNATKAGHQLATIKKVRQKIRAPLRMKRRGKSATEAEGVDFYIDYLGCKIVRLLWPASGVAATIIMCRVESVVGQKKVKNGYYVGTITKGGADGPNAKARGA